MYIQIYGSAPFIRRDEIWVCALYTQGRYMGLRPLYVGMIYGSAPFIRRVDTWVCALYTQGCWPGIMYIRVCAQIHRDLARDYIYIHITQNIYMCVHMSCLSHA